MREHFVGREKGIKGSKSRIERDRMSLPRDYGLKYGTDPGGDLQKGGVKRRKSWNSPNKHVRNRKAQGRKIPNTKIFEQLRGGGGLGEAPNIHRKKMLGGKKGFLKRRTMWKKKLSSQTQVGGRKKKNPQKKN